MISIVRVVSNTQRQLLRTVSCDVNKTISSSSYMFHGDLLWAAMMQLFLNNYDVITMQFRTAKAAMLLLVSVMASNRLSHLLT